MSFIFYNYFLLAADALKDSIRTYNLGEIIITAERDNVILATTTNEIDALSIQVSNSSSIESALFILPGIHTSLSPKNESQIFLRGFSQNQTALFMDGVPIYLPYDQLLDLDLLPTHSVEKITVTKSLPSILYGPNAMGGAVNIISTQKIGKPSASVNLQVGNMNLASLGTSGSIDRFYFNISGAYAKSNGFTMSNSAPVSNWQNGKLRKNSQFVKRSAFVKLGFQRIENFDAALSFLIVDDVKGIPTSIFTTKPRYWRFTDWRKKISNFMFNTEAFSNVNIRGNIYYEKFNNTLDSYDDDTFKSQTKPFAFHSVYDDDTYGANVSARMDKFIFGITKVSFTFKQDRHAEMGNFNQPFKRYEIETYSAGVEQDFSFFSGYQFVVGLGNDWMHPVYANGQSLRSSVSILNGYIGVSKVVSENSRLYGHVSRKSRFPAMKEFYAEILGRNAPNPNLKQEIALNTEVGAEIKLSDEFNIRSTFFYNDVDGLIQTVLIDSAIQQYQNIGTAEFKGFEVTSVYRTQHSQIDANYIFLLSRNTTKGAATTILEYRPEHTLNISCRYFFENGFSVTSDLKMVSSFYGVEVDPPRKQKALPSYTIINIGIAQEITSHYKIFCRVNNLTDKFYQADYGFPQPGREWSIGILANW